MSRSPARSGALAAPRQTAEPPPEGGAPERAGSGSAPRRITRRMPPGDPAVRARRRMGLALGALLAAVIGVVAYAALSFIPF